MRKKYLPPYFLKLLHSSEVSLVFSVALVEQTWSSWLSSSRWWLWCKVCLWKYVSLIKIMMWMQMGIMNPHWGWWDGRYWGCWLLVVVSSAHWTKTCLYNNRWNSTKTFAKTCFRAELTLLEVDESVSPELKFTWIDWQFEEFDYPFWFHNLKPGTISKDTKPFKYLLF